MCFTCFYTCSFTFNFRFTITIALAYFFEFFHQVCFFLESYTFWCSLVNIFTMSTFSEQVVTRVSQCRCCCKIPCTQALPTNHGPIAVVFSVDRNASFIHGTGVHGHAASSVTLTLPPNARPAPVQPRDGSTTSPQSSADSGERTKRTLFSTRATIEIDSPFDGVDLSLSSTKARFEQLNGSVAK